MERQQVTDTESQQVTESEGSGKSEVDEDVQEQAMEDAVRCGVLGNIFSTLDRPARYLLRQGYQHVST